MTTRTEEFHEAGLAETRSIAEAARRLGLDSFTVYRLIQQDELQAERAPWGEFRIPQSELNRILQPSGFRPNAGANREDVC